MIDTADIQADIVAKLKAHSPLTDLVGEDIREENWMGADYTYPCARIHISRLQPLGVAGSCEDTGFVCDFTVIYRTTTPSSAPAAYGVMVCTEALVNKKLAKTGSFVSRTGVVLQDVAGPIPEGKNAWAARAFFNCRLQEV